MKSPLKVALLQMALTESVVDNAARIHDALDRSAAEHARLLVVPEGALSGYPIEFELDLRALETARQDVVAHASRAGLWLALGMVRPVEGGLCNSALLYSPAGELVLSYDKTHLTGSDKESFQPGQELPVARAGEWTVGLQICYDMRFPENWRILRRKGAELVIHLVTASRHSPWKVPVLEGAVRSRAAENGMFVVSANDARAPQMMVSCACDPDGRDLARAPANEEVLLFAELDRSAVNSGHLQDRRTDLWAQPEHRNLLLN